MNQRILLPAIVIGGVFAVLLTFARGQLPEGDALLAFAVDAAFVVAAVLVYGALMREAAAAAPATKAAPASDAGERKEGRSRRSRGGRGGRGRGGEGRGGEGRGGEGRGSEGRGGEGRGDRGRKRDAGRDTEERKAPAGPREEGHVKWFSGAKGYGFIIRPDGEEIFVHHRALRDKSRREIPDGHPVSYVVVDRDKGPQADDVDLADGGATENAA